MPWRTALTLFLGGFNMYKKILAGMLAVVLVFGSSAVLPATELKNGGVISVSAETFNDSTIVAYTSDVPTLSEDSAAVFVAFLANNGSLSESEIKSTDYYKIMTNTYHGDDKLDKMESLYLYAVMSAQEMSDQSISNRDFLINNVVEYLEKHTGEFDNEADDILNGYKNQALNAVVKYFEEFHKSIYRDSMIVYDGYSEISGTISKAEKIIDYSLAALSGFYAVIESENSGRYSYFSAYISNRKNYSSADDEIFKFIMDYNRFAASQNNILSKLIDSMTWLTGKDSFSNHYDLIDSWAEYTYQLHKYVCDQLGNDSSNTDPAVNGTGKVNVANSTSGLKVENLSVSIGKSGSDKTDKTIKIGSDGKFTVEGLADGNYDLTFNADKCVPRTYSVSVSGGTFKLDSVELHLYGDVNGDGELTTADVGKANADTRNSKKLTDSYDKKVADVNEDGKITTADVGKTNAHVRGTKNLW